MKAKKVIYKKMSEWLSEPTKDQNLERIEDLPKTLMTGFRKWFASRQISPVAKVAWYNPTTSKWVLGDSNHFTPAISFSTASVAALTLTCAAGHRYKVYFAACDNYSAADVAVLSGVISGNAVLNIATADNANDPAILIGGANNMGGGAIVNNNVNNHIWLNAGDTLTMTLTLFAGGNNTEHYFLYEDYIVENL